MSLFTKKIYLSAINSLYNKDNILFLFTLFIAGTLFFFYKKLVISPISYDLKSIVLLVPVIMVAMGYKLSIKSYPISFKILLRTTVGVISCYLIIAFPTIPLDSHDPTTTFLLKYGRFFAAGAGIVGCFYLLWGIIPLTFILYYKAIHANFLDITISYTDYLPLVEISLFLIFLALTHHIISCTKWSSKTNKASSNLCTMEKFFLVSIALHLSNYFYSGYKKIFLGERPFSWALENNTQYLLLNARELGQLPIGFNDTFSGLIYEFLAMTVVPTNILLFLGQLFAIIAICRIRWALWATIFYDLTHIVIFAVSGIFFYKWIILNTAIVFALNTIKNKKIDPFLQCVLIITVLGAPSFFFVAKLGWWDTPALNIERFYAVTKDNKEVAVPSNYWGAYSVHMAQQRIIWDKANGFLPTGTYGIIFGQDNMYNAQDCNYDINKDTNEGDAIDKIQGNDPMKPFVQSYHDWALNASNGRLNWKYNMYPHHIFSFPWIFSDFRNIDLHDVTAYRYKITSVCLEHTNGEFKRKILKEKSYDIPIK
jgi:hypothetical protein